MRQKKSWLFWNLWKAIMNIYTRRNEYIKSCKSIAHLGPFDASILLDAMETFCFISFHGTTPCYITNLLHQIKFYWVFLRVIFPMYKTLFWKYFSLNEIFLSSVVFFEIWEQKYATILYQTPKPDHQIRAFRIRFIHRVSYISYSFTCI